MIDGIGKFLIGLWLTALLWVILSSGPDDSPPSAPAGVGYAHGYPIHYTSPALPVFPTPVKDPALDYQERFSPACIGPDWAWAEAATEGCPIATGAVWEQGVGE